MANQVDSPWNDEIEEITRKMVRHGVPYSVIGKRIGFTKSQIAGWVNRNRDGLTYDGPTTMERLQAMHDKLDAVLAESKRLRMRL